MRELFRNLVTAQGTRAVRDYDELLSVFGEKRDEAETVLRGLIDARLLVEYEERTGRNDAERPRRRVEIIHESLLAAWPRLVRWQAQDAEGALLRDQLRQAAATWEERSRASDLLWTGTAYQEFSVWQERYPGGLTATEKAFAEAMTAETQRRRRRRRIAVTTLVSVLLSGLLVVSALWRQSVKAERAREAEALRAQASQLLALARNEFERDPTNALAYVRKSLELADEPQARLFALEILWKRTGGPHPVADQGRGGARRAKRPQGVDTGPRASAPTRGGSRCRIATPNASCSFPTKAARHASCPVPRTATPGRSSSAPTAISSSRVVWDRASDCTPCRTCARRGPSSWEAPGPLLGSRDGSCSPPPTPVRSAAEYVIRAWPFPEGAPRDLATARHATPGDLGHRSCRPVVGQRAGPGHLASAARSLERRLPSGSSGASRTNSRESAPSASFATERASIRLRRPAASVSGH